MWGMRLGLPDEQAWRRYRQSYVIAFEKLNAVLRDYGRVSLLLGRSGYASGSQAVNEPVMSSWKWLIGEILFIL